MNSKPRWGGSARRGRNFAKTLTAWRDTVPAAIAAGTRIARETQVVLIPEGIGFVSAIFVGSMIQQDMVPERFESHIRHAPVIFLGEPIWRKFLRHSPNALTRHNRNLSPSACSS
jgi:hypothetical protein